MILWNRADSNNIKAETLEFENEFKETYDIDCNINNTWSHIKGILRAIIERHVPS